MVIGIKLIKIKIRLRKGIPLPDAEASKGGRYGSAQPISYEKSGGLAELPIVINVKVKARGASPTPPLQLRIYLLNKGGASSEPDEAGSSIGNWRTPNITLIDDDGVLDGHAKEGVADSDSDGIKNCLDYDSDDDGVYDGTELGVTTAIPETDEIKGTDINSPHFVIDSDPSTTTDPTEPDDDGDHLLDGLEDKNHNGAFDEGETDPKEVDTDGDGLYDGSALNPYDNPGEDLNDNGVVDDEESDPRKKDTDGDNLWDGDEVNPADIKLDKYINRQKSGSWYSSDPFDVDSDDDGLNDDQEIIGWPVRIFWEATLETVKGPYDVYSNPMVKDTDDDGLKDDGEFAYGSDPDEPDTDDDNVDDDVEVDRGDNPCGIEGRPPEITELTVNAVPVVDDYQGTPYLKGWDVTVSISAEDSSGPYKFALKVLGGTLVEVELQEEDEDGYYKTEIDGSATVYVKNDGSWDYCSAFITSTEDSVGNVLGTYIIGDGLPQYSNNILTLINDGEKISKYKKSISGVEYKSVPEDIININIEDCNWLIDKINERIEYQLKAWKLSSDNSIKIKSIQFSYGINDITKSGNIEELENYIKSFDWPSESENGGTRGYWDDPYYGKNTITTYLYILIFGSKKSSKKEKSEIEKIVDKLKVMEEKKFTTDGELSGEIEYGDGLVLAWEEVWGTDDTKYDSDYDMLNDYDELRAVFRTNVKNGDYSCGEGGIKKDKWIEVDSKWLDSIFNKYTPIDKSFTLYHYYVVGDYKDINNFEKSTGYEVVSIKKIGSTTEGYPLHYVIYKRNDGGFFYSILVEHHDKITQYWCGGAFTGYDGAYMYEPIHDAKPLIIYGSYEYDSSFDPVKNIDIRELLWTYTDPTNPNTDGDNMIDGFEEHIGNTPPNIYNGVKAIHFTTAYATAMSCEAMTWFLVNKYNVPESNIVSIEKHGTSEDFKNALINLNENKNDLVFIQLNAHSPGEGFINYGKGIYFNNDKGTDEFHEFIKWSTIDDWLDTYIYSRILVVLLATCHSGWGGDILSKNDNPSPRIIYASSAKEESSYAGNFINYFYEGFGYDSWKLHEYYIEDEYSYEADVNFGDSNGYVSMKEAFERAKAIMEDKHGDHPNDWGDIDKGSTTYFGDYKYFYSP